MGAALAARLALAGLGTVGLQVGAVSHIQVVGATADLLPLVVAATGLVRGSTTGAFFGFAAGLLLDSALAGTLGLSSLIYVVVGYAAGRARDRRGPCSALTAMAVGAAATAAATIGFSLVESLLGVAGPLSFPPARVIVAAVLLNALIAPPVLGLVRRWLAPALLEHQPHRWWLAAQATGRVDA
jgi:rod shape-determining protein MreD